MSRALPGVTTAVDRGELDAENPWPGLASFTEAQSAFFHGRSAEIRTLTRLLERNPLTVLFGQSGLGKSSLLQAGVFPRLRAGGLCPLTVRLDHGAGAADLAEQVKRQVATATAGAGTWTVPGAAKPGESLWEYFHHRDNRLVDVRRQPLVPVLVFDQFEELFTLSAASGGPRERASAFFGQLAELVENRPAEVLVRRLDDSPEEMDAFDFQRADYRVCLSIREDFLPHLESLKQIMPALMETRMRLTRMTGAQAIEAVLQPGGALTSPEVARAIVEFVAGGSSEAGSLEELSVEPPLLSVICRELNDRRRRRGQPQITADLVSGNRQQILSAFYERGVADLPEAVRRLAEDRLVTKSGFRDSVALEAVLEEPGVTRAAVGVLVERRLVRLEERLGAQRIELSHDVLVPVIRAAREARRQREAGRRTRRWLLAAAAATTLATIGAGWGVRAQRKAVLERQAEVVRSARTDLELADRLGSEGRAREALAYLVRAAEKNPDEPTIGPRLLSALTQRSFSLPDAPPLDLGSPPLRAQVSGDGRRVYVQGRDHVIRIVDLGTWAVERTLQFPAAVVPGGWALAENAPGILAVELSDGTLAICDSSTGAQLRPPLRRPSALHSPQVRGPQLALSADGQVLCSGDGSAVWFWDTNTGRLIATERPSMPNLLAGHSLSPQGNRWLRYKGIGRITAVEFPAKREGLPLANDRTLGLYRGGEFSPDGKRVLVTFQYGSQVLDVASGALLAGLPGISQVEQAVFSPDGCRLVVATQDWSARLFHDDRAIAILSHRAPITGLQLSADGATLLTCTASGEARVWDMATGAALGEPTFGHAGAPAVLSRDGRWLVLFSDRGEAHRLRVAREPARPLQIAGNVRQGMLAAFLEDQPSQLLWMNQDRALSIDVLAARLGPAGFAYPHPVSDKQARPRLVLASRTGWVPEPALFAALVGNRMEGWRWSGRGSEVTAMAFEGLSVSANRILSSETGARATFSENFGRRIMVWDTDTGKRVSEIRSSLEIMGPGNSPLEFSPDGRSLVFQTHDGALRIADVESGQERIRLERSSAFPEPVRVAGFSRDGNRLFTGNLRGRMQVWDTRSGRLAASVEGHRGEITGLAVAAAGNRFATWSPSGTVQLWEADRGMRAGGALRHDRGVRLAAFSADGARLATAADDGVVRIWDVATAQPITEPLRVEEASGITSVGFNPDGRLILVRASVPRVGKVSFRVWPVPPPATGSAPAWLIQLAGVCAGQRVTAAGELVPHDAWAGDFALAIQALEAAPEGDEWAAWGRWLTSDPARRSIAPGLRATPEAVQELQVALAAPVPVPAAAGRQP